MADNSERTWERDSDELLLLPRLLLLAAQVFISRSHGSYGLSVAVSMFSPPACGWRRKMPWMATGSGGENPATVVVSYS